MMDSWLWKMRALVDHARAPQFTWWLWHIRCSPMRAGFFKCMRVALILHGAHSFLSAINDTCAMRSFIFFWGVEIWTATLLLYSFFLFYIKYDMVCTIFMVFVVLGSGKQQTRMWTNFPAVFASPGDSWNLWSEMSKTKGAFPSLALGNLNCVCNMTWTDVVINVWRVEICEA